MARPVLAAAAALLVATTVSGQAPRYAASQLSCAQFVERVETEIHGEAGGRPRNETGGRVARWIVRGATADSGVRIEAWLDSLVIWRKADEGVHSPNTDGLIGGRYRGTLSPVGGYTSLARPFVPDEVAEFADLRDAFADLLPPLPAVAILPGGGWHDGEGLTIERLGDSVGGGAAVERYRAARHAANRAVRLGGLDTLSIPVRQTTVEEGEFAWDAARGVVRRTRTITVDTDVPAQGSLRVPVRSRVVQRVTLERLPDDPAACR